MNLTKYKPTLLLSGLSLLFLSLFVKLTVDVWTKGSVWFDEIIADWVNNFRNAGLTSSMEVITHMGETTLIIGLLALAILFLYFKGHKKYIVPLVLSVGGNVFIIQSLKILISRQRPVISDSLAVEHSFSFPSGHTLMTIAFYGLIFLFLFNYYKSDIYKFGCVIFASTFVLLIGFSRLYLGVHWPSDVVASLLLGLFELSLIQSIMLSSDLKMKIHEIINKFLFIISRPDQAQNKV